ncbi:hypothetical protein [Thiosulfatihalobacter marinus]|uniref:hypothetical protein n=1 Tax=Thiosulfatihalobacter marinus TaxID=2792481 RepID=UPI0018D5C5B1|nr:hypothetical protein [Thiosulfatihalobacter marinus]
MVVESGDLVFWEGSAEMAKDADGAAKQLRAWIQEFQPDVVVSENPDAAGKKSGVQIPILQAFVEVAQDVQAVNLVVRRERPFQNVYDEAKRLAEEFPDLEGMVPEKPPIWGKEPYNLVFFEALALMRDAGLLQPLAGPAKADAEGEAV